MMYVEVMFRTWNPPILTPAELQLSWMGQPDENPNGYGKGLEKLLLTQEPWHLFSELLVFACEITKRTVIVIEKDNFAWYNFILGSWRRKQSNHQLSLNFSCSWLFFKGCSNFWPKKKMATATSN